MWENRESESNYEWNIRTSVLCLQNFVFSEFYSEGVIQVA